MVRRRETKKTVIGGIIKHKHGEVVIKDFKGSDGRVSEFIAECDICSLDKELWPYGTLVYDMVNIKRNEIICGCGRSVSWKDWQIKLQVERMLVGGNLKFSGFEGGVYKGKETKIILSAEGEEDWKILMSNLSKQPFPIFSKGHKRDSRVLDNIKSLENNPLLPNHYKYFYDKVQNKYQVSCSVCDSDTQFRSIENKLYSARLDSLKIGRKPCRCSRTYKFSNEERMIQINNQVKERGLVKIKIPDKLNSRSRVTWECNNGHTQHTKLDDFIRVECNKLVGNFYGYYPDRKFEQDNLYLIKFTKESELFYKIGRSFNIKERMRKMGGDYDVELLTSVQGEHQEIWGLEQELHKELSSFDHHVEFYFDGCVGECFKPIILDHPKVVEIFNNIVITP